MKQIFKVGDTVYHWNYGKGKVNRISNGDRYSISVEFKHTILSFTPEGRFSLKELPTLSHTPYDLINGGFSQRKPLPNIKKGTPVYIKFPTTKRWGIRVFSHFNDEGNICTFNDGRLEGDVNEWEEYSLENPIKYNEE